MSRIPGLRRVFRLGEATGRPGAAEVEEELRFHIESRVAELAARGVPETKAREAAEGEFGEWTHYREAVLAVDRLHARRARVREFIDSIWTDVRHATRGLVSRPAFTLAVVVTLALGIGANTAMFSVVDRLLFRPPPMLRHPGRVHRVYLAATYRRTVVPRSEVEYARFVDLTKWTSSFSRTAEFTNRSLAVGDGGETAEMPVGVVSASFFGFFDAPPILGRYFTPAEDQPPAGTRVAVLSHALWQTRYGGHRDVLGRPIRIGATLYTIIGVASRGFAGLWPERPPAAYIPITAFGPELAAALHLRGERWWATYNNRWGRMIVERKPTVSVAAADADLTKAYLKSYLAEAASSPGMTAVTRARPHGFLSSVLRQRGPDASRDARVAAWLSGVALVVWLVACANVANLLLARALGRRREIAVRLALGVSRARLARQLLSESLVLAALGGAAGVLVAQWGGALLRARLLGNATVLTDPRTLLFAGAVALLAGLGTGLAPLFQTRRADLTRDLKAGDREGGGQRSRLRAALLVAQASLSVVLLVGAGLFVRSLRHVERLSLGYTVDSVLAVNLQMRGVTLDSARSVALRRRLLDGAQAIPGVTHVSRQLTTPFWSDWSTELHVAGIDSVQRLGGFDLNAVSSDYFATMGTRILRGRGITEQDVAGAPLVMVVSQAMARALWPGRDPLDRCVQVGSRTAPCTTVVGVAENIRSQSLRDESGFFYYLPASQYHPELGGLFVRVHGDPARALETVRRGLQSLMPGASYVTVTSLADILSGETDSWRLGATLFSAFGVLALVLAGIGLYSVIAHNVARRTRELGVRSALGAQLDDLVRLVLADGLRLALLGVALGAGIALIAGRWVQPLLFEESARDPTVFATVAVVLLGVAALASYVPARRAGRMDPVRALRSE